MKNFFKLCLCGCMAVSLCGCSDAPECWDDKVKKGLAELLEEKYGWDKIKLSEIRELDSDFDSRTCSVSVDYDSIFADAGPMGMAFSQAIYGRKFTTGTEQIAYKVTIHGTEQHGKQAFIEILAISDENENEFNRYMNQVQRMRQ